MPDESRQGSLDYEDTVLRPFNHRGVYEHEQSGQDFFLTKFRSCSVLFVCFLGIDYDVDKAQAQLDAFICQLQAIASRYEKAQLQLTIGEEDGYA